MIAMRGMNQILTITDDSVTVQAGAILIDVAQALRERGLQFYVNTEIGNLSMGWPRAPARKLVHAGRVRAGKLGTARASR